MMIFWSKNGETEMVTVTNLPTTKKVLLANDTSYIKHTQAGQLRYEPSLAPSLMPRWKFCWGREKPSWSVLPILVD
jgi:hypothetical protein